MTTEEFASITAATSGENERRDSWRRTVGLTGPTVPSDRHPEQTRTAPTVASPNRTRIATWRPVGSI